MSFPDSYLSSFWPIFLKLCMDIDIRVEWFGITNGLNSFINNRPLIGAFFLNIFRTNGWIVINFWICIDKYKIHVASDAHCFWSIFNRVMALDRRQNFVYAQHLVNWFVDFDQILSMHWYWQNADLDYWTIFFVHFQQIYGFWLMWKYVFLQYLQNKWVNFDKILYMQW